MPELTSRVTKSDITAKRASPLLVEEDGRTLGRHETAYALIPPGAVVTVELKINGKTERILGPWEAVAADGLNACAGVLFQVTDSCSQDSLQESDLGG